LACLFLETRKIFQKVKNSQKSVLSVSVRVDPVTWKLSMTEEHAKTRVVSMMGLQKQRP
jgi:hypothetical protein